MRLRVGTYILLPPLVEQAPDPPPWSTFGQQITINNPLFTSFYQLLILYTEKAENPCSKGLSALSLGYFCLLLFN